MKVNFSREVKYIPMWNGNRDLPENEQAVAMLQPLQMQDLILLMDTMQSASGGELDPETMTALDGNNVDRVKHLVEACGKLVPKYCQISGIEDESGPVDSELLVQFPFFMELSAEILGELGTISMPSETEEKNFEPQQGSQPTTTQ